MSSKFVQKLLRNPAARHMNTDSGKKITSFDQQK